MRLSDEEEEDEDPVLRGKRLWKQWQQSRMQQNDDDGGDGDDGEGGCSVAESLLQALSKNKKLKRYKPLTASLGSEESLGDGSLRSISSAAGAGAAPDAAAAAPLVSAHIQQLSRTRCCLTRDVLLLPLCLAFCLPLPRHISRSSASSFKVSSVEEMCVTRHTPHATRHTSSPLQLHVLSHPHRDQRNVLRARRRPLSRRW
jgi:hypothetical protein